MEEDPSKRSANLRRGSGDSKSISRIVNDASLQHHERSLPQPASPGSEFSSSDLFMGRPSLFRSNTVSDERSKASYATQLQPEQSSTSQSNRQYASEDVLNSSSGQSSHWTTALESSSYSNWQSMRSEDQYLRAPRPASEEFIPLTESSHDSKRRLHASRQGARRSQNRAVLNISLAQNRIDSSFRPVSTLSSYNKQQSGRDVKETDVISLSTMTSAAKSRVYSEIIESMSHQCRQVILHLNALQQRTTTDKSLSNVAAELIEMLGQAIDAGQSAHDMRDRVGETVLHIHPLYEALIHDVQQRTDNRAGDSSFDVHGYLEHESALFREMRTGSASAERGQAGGQAGGQAEGQTSRQHGRGGLSSPSLPHP